ncbi:MAG: rRNA maturation RNase YbeY [Candidatus Pacebacteria bacterium]|nr:rRNA maturation RNase YbeY [Candidatus Paceibacterota bacterium]
MKVDNFCTIRNQTKGKLPSLPFVSIKNKILGKKYDLSICFISSKKQKEINKKYRGIDKSTNVLSFPFSSNSGEITFDLTKVKREAPLFMMSYSKFLKYLLIHGCLHLKGFEHSSTMEKQEEKYLKFFS